MNSQKQGMAMDGDIANSVRENDVDTLSALTLSLLAVYS